MKRKFKNMLQFSGLIGFIFVFFIFAMYYLASLY